MATLTVLITTVLFISVLISFELVFFVSGMLSLNILKDMSRWLKNQQHMKFYSIYIHIFLLVIPAFIIFFLFKIFLPGAIINLVILAVLGRLAFNVTPQDIEEVDFAVKYMRIKSHNKMFNLLLNQFTYAILTSLLIILFALTKYL